MTLDKLNSIDDLYCRLANHGCILIIRLSKVLGLTV